MDRSDHETVKGAQTSSKFAHRLAASESVEPSAQRPFQITTYCETNDAQAGNASAAQQATFQASDTKRYAANNATTGAEFEPAVDRRITASPVSTTDPHHVDKQQKSALDIRELPPSKESPASRINAGLRQARQRHQYPSTSAPLYYTPDGNRIESLTHSLNAENAQSFKTSTYFGTGLGNHRADERAFAYPLGRRRASELFDNPSDYRNYNHRKHHSY